MSLVRPEELGSLLARLDAAPSALLAIGIPRCPACRLLPASLAAVARARPSLAVGLALLEGPRDWALREELLWPRGIRVSRASVPSLAVLREGRQIGRRDGGGPAHVLDAWLEGILGPAESPLAPGVTDEERAILEEAAPRRVQRAMARAAQGPDGPGGHCAL
jgi:hypothetical protein